MPPGCLSLQDLVGLGARTMRRVSSSLEIFHEFSFAAAHRLPNVPDGHRCAALHGHNSRVVISVEGVPDPHTGWIMDFADLADALRPVLVLVDHAYLNDVPGLSNPTSERLAEWLWERVSPAIDGLLAITVRESDRTGCTIRRSGHSPRLGVTARGPELTPAATPPSPPASTDAAPTADPTTP